MPRTLLLAPAGRQVGLTTVCLGLVRSLDWLGARVAFVKPVAGRGEDRSVALVRLAARVDPPAPISRSVAEELLAAGDDQTLMEHVVEVCSRAATGAEVLVVEGMVPEPGIVWSSRVNTLMQKALDADLVLVGASHGESPAELAGAVEIAARGFGLPQQRVGVVLNRVCGRPGQARHEGVEGIGAACSSCEGASDCAPALEAHRSALAAEELRPLAVLPCRRDLLAPRMKDLAVALGAEMLTTGDSDRRRFDDVALAAMTVPNAIRAFRPGTLVITPGDRNDILVATALAVQAGVPLAGLLLTGGLRPDPAVLELCQGALSSRLPVLAVAAGSYAAANAVAAMDRQIPVDDQERVERSAGFVADRLDPSWVKGLLAANHVPRLSPPAFRHRLVEAARAANKRIVLPEGAEPRTVAAAAIVQERGIARCVLLGDPEEVREAARKQGVTLPASVEIIDPASVAESYVAPLVERRKAKGMTEDIARSELSDSIMVGTMMMALGEADGLVSGAVHTTAHTIRPALQIIKTVPGCNLVSSVFFMCLPDQVVVFGDCAVNPNPTAEQLADIAIQSADSAAAFGIPPRVAMLSYSTGTSGGGADVEKVKRATELARQLRPDLLLDGPLQYDAAVMPDVALAKAPHSAVAGKATVFVFPDLNSGNVTYKAVQRSANLVSMGPLLQGLAKPVNDLSRGCLVEDIVFTITLTAIQAARAGQRPT